MHQGWEFSRVPNLKHWLKNSTRLDPFDPGAGIIFLTALKNTQSRLPSSVYNLNANPRASRTLSAEPLSPATVENRANKGVFLPTLSRNARLVTSDMSWVTSNSPKAPAPLACTSLYLVRRYNLHRREIRNL